MSGFAAFVQWTDGDQFETRATSRRHRLRLQRWIFGITAAISITLGAATPAQAPARKPNIQFIGTFREFPPSQKGGSFALDAVLQSLETPGKSD